MPAPTSSDTKAAIFAHHRNGLSCRKITAALLDMGMTASRSTVSRVINECQSMNQGILKPLKRLGPQNLPSKRTKALIKKVDLATENDNPPTQIALARRHGVSRTLIRRILVTDLKAKLLKKTKTHALSNKQVQQRLDKGNALLKILGGGRRRCIISLDEAWLSLNDCGGITDSYYRKMGKEVPASRSRKWRQKHPQKSMFAAGVCARGVTDMYFVPDKSKVNQEFFMNYILKPIIERDIPRLYPGEEKKVILHFDSAFSHTTPAVYALLKKAQVQYIDKENWTSNSPDLRPMDYGCNGFLKNPCLRRSRNPSLV